MAENGNVLPGVIADAVFEIVDDGTTRIAKLKSSVDKIELQAPEVEVIADDLDAGYVRYASGTDTLIVGESATTEATQLSLKAKDAAEFGVISAVAGSVELIAEKPIVLNSLFCFQVTLDAGGNYANSGAHFQAGQLVFLSFDEAGLSAPVGALRGVCTANYCNIYSTAGATDAGQKVNVLILSNNA